MKQLYTAKRFGEARLAWAKQWYAPKLRAELKSEYGKGARMLSDTELRNRLVKRYVRFSLDRWSKDLSSGRKVRQ
jgi:hypothetical protein